LSSSIRSRVVAAIFAALCLAGTAHAKVFYSQKEALALAFPRRDRVDDRSILLDDAQADKVQKLATSRPRVAARAHLHRVSRQRAARLRVHRRPRPCARCPRLSSWCLSPAGAVRDLRLLAFHEPLEYMPSARWFQQFESKTLAAPLRLGGDVHGIVGATLSSRAATEGVRRALALYQVVVPHPE
jgi:hypothetical protein